MLVETEDSPRFLVAAEEPRLLVENEAFIRKLIALPTPLDLVPPVSSLDDDYAAWVASF